MRVLVSRCLLGLQLLALLAGTQMPGAWRSDIAQSLHVAPWVSSFAHFALFASLTVVLVARPLRWPLARIVLAALALALLTEALQFLAVERHPSWMDVGIDMAGVLAGVVIMKMEHLLCRGRQ